MGADEILAQLTEGTVLEGPHWTEPVRVLTAKGRGSRFEVQAVGQKQCSHLRSAEGGH